MRRPVSTLSYYNLIEFLSWEDIIKLCEIWQQTNLSIIKDFEHEIVINLFIHPSREKGLYKLQAHLKGITRDELERFKNVIKKASKFFIDAYEEILWEIGIDVT